MLKKVIKFTIIICFFSTAALANFNLDLNFNYGYYLHTPEIGPSMEFNCYGAGLGLGGDVHRDINLVSRMTFITGEKDMMAANISLLEIGAFLGIEYIPHINALIRNRIKWINTVMFGWCYYEQEFTQPLGFTDSMDDMGLGMLIATGLQFQIKQHIAPFFLVGYQKVFYLNKFTKMAFDNVILMAGFRFSFFKSQTLGSEY